MASAADSSLQRNLDAQVEVATVCEASCGDECCNPTSPLLGPHGTAVPSNTTWHRHRTGLRPATVSLQNTRVATGTGQLHMHAFDAVSQVRSICRMPTLHIALESRVLQARLTMSSLAECHISA